MLGIISWGRAGICKITARLLTSVTSFLLVCSSRSGLFLNFFANIKLVNGLNVSLLLQLYSKNLLKVLRFGSPPNRIIQDVEGEVFEAIWPSDVAPCRNMSHFSQPSCILLGSMCISPSHSYLTAAECLKPIHFTAFVGLDFHNVHPLLYVKC